MKRFEIGAKFNCFFFQIWRQIQIISCQTQKKTFNFNNEKKIKRFEIGAKFNCFSFKFGAKFKSQKTNKKKTKKKD